VLVEPEIDRSALRDLLRRDYGRDVTALTFVPKGLDSWSYVAEAGDGSRVFLKLTEPSRPGASRQRGAELPLMVALADLGLRVPRPIAARDGALMRPFGPYRLTLLAHLEGRTLEDESVWPEPLYARVAEALAAIHASTERVRHLVPGAETYELPFLPGLLAGVDRLVTGAPVPAGDEQTVDELRRLLAPRADQLRAVVARLEALRRHAGDRAGETVLCHTDLWGSNLVLDAAGELSVIDWDGASIGPPELDLFLFADPGFFPADRLDWFVDRYQAAFRPIQLDRDVLAYYVHRRNLEDLAEFVLQLTRTGGDDADRRAALGIVARLVEAWPRLDEPIVALRRRGSDRR
jgi:spectinomycin phosphotransferase